MARSLRPETRRYLCWAIGLSLLHAGLLWGVVRPVQQWLWEALGESSIALMLMRDRYVVAFEFAIWCDVLLTMPIGAFVVSFANTRYPNQLSVWPADTLEWAVIIGNTLIYGFGGATVLRWLQRPPKWLARIAPPFVTRQRVALALVLAALHLVMTFVVYFGTRWEASRFPWKGSWYGPRGILTLLHPPLLAGRPSGSWIPMGIALLDALAWGIVVSALIVVVGKLFHFDVKTAARR